MDLLENLFLNFKSNQIPLTLLVVLILFASFILKGIIFRSKAFNIKKKIKIVINKWFHLWVCVVVFVYVVITISSLFFLSNFLGKRNVVTITSSEVEEDFTKEALVDIIESNNKALNRKGVIKRKDATRDNNKAMKEADKLFN